MKIIIFSWRDIKHPSAGGAEIATHEHAKYWAEKGDSVTIFSSDFKGAKKNEKYDGVSFVRRGSQLGSVYVYAFLWYMKLKNKPDIVIDQVHGVGFLTPIYIRNKPKLVYIHEVAKEVWFRNHLKFPLNYIYGSIGFMIEPFMHRFVYGRSKYLVVSESTKFDLVKFGIKKDNIKTIHNGVTTLNSKFSKNKKKTAIYLGALAEDKGIFEALEIFGYINQMDPKWKFWIVGKGDKKITQKLVRKVSEVGVNKNTKFFGFVDEQTKFNLLAKSHFLINPSMREGWGLVNIEANSVGTPVAAYDVPGIRDSVIENKSGFLVKYGENELMADKVIDVTRNPQKYLKLSNSARKWSNQFNWGKSSSNIHKHLKELCQE